MDRQALLKNVAERAWQASHASSDIPGASQLKNPLPAASRGWLQATAASFGMDERQQRQFSDTGTLKLDALHVVLVCQSETPVPLWLVTGWLKTPEAIHPEVWQEMLLRANGMAMAMNGIGLALDESGATLLSRRLAFDEVNDAEALAEILNDFNSLASSLVDLLLSLGQADDAPPAGDAPALPGWIAGWQQQNAASTDELAARALAIRWHYPLLQQAIDTLRLPTTRYLLDGCLCSLRFPEREISVMADGDGRHLLLSTPLALNGESARQLLTANQELQILTHCSIALCDEQLSLLCRWDSLGLDGIDFAEWLADLMTLTVAFERREQTR